MKESKNTLTPEMLGALSQAKQIYSQLSKNGVSVDAVSSETGKEHLMLFEFVFTVSLVRNRKLQEENAIARSIINEYIIVDMAMSDNEAYQKERTQIHESIQKNGYYVTWDEVCRLRAENP